MERPENTLKAFQYALEIGCQMLECDVRITKDDVLIVCHDEDSERLCGDKRKIIDCNYADLPKFKKEMPMHFSKMSSAGQF